MLYNVPVEIITLQQSRTRMLLGQLSLPSLQLRLGRQKQLCFIPFGDKRVGGMVKLSRLMTTLALAERLRCELPVRSNTISICSPYVSRLHKTQ